MWAHNDRELVFLKGGGEKMLVAYVTEPAL